MANKQIIIFVHGWGVRNTSTYGEFPARLESEVKKDKSLELDIRHIWLGKYISFRDEVQLEDISRAFDSAIKKELGSELNRGKRFACITHSTGGPVIRDWWHRYYISGRRKQPCPMSHLIMLAPANFGSALAQLGKSRIGSLKSWFEGVEPGEGVLNWLELGSPESWKLNLAWIYQPDATSDKHPVFPFVLTGQMIDRKLYDHVNSYTGETGSDGVVRVATANMNATYVKLEQENVQVQKSGKIIAPKLAPIERKRAHRTAFAIIEGRSHSGEEMGILKSIYDVDRPHPTVSAVLDCLKVRDNRSYLRLCRQFDDKNAKIMKKEQVEIIDRKIFPDSYFIHDACSMLIFRLHDDRGRTIEDFDLIITGRNNNPDSLPPGFFMDRQRNTRHKGTITYFVNYDLMVGSPPVKKYKRKKIIVFRKATKGVERLGIRIKPRPLEGFVHYLECNIAAAMRNLKEFLHPNETTLIDIVIRRFVHEGVFRLTQNRAPEDFTDTPTGPPVV